MFRIAVLIACSALACGRGRPPAAPLVPAPAPPVPPTLEVVRVTTDFVAAFLLVPGDGTAALIDCGFDPEAKGIIAALTARGLTPEDVTSIFITHRHGDHVAGCGPFARATVRAFPGGEGDDGTVAVADGERVAIGGFEAIAYAVPGHTADSGALLIDGALYLGDAALAEGEVIRASPWIFEGEGRRPDDDHVNAATLERLHARLVAEGREVRTLRMAHSPDVAGLAPLGSPKR